MFSSWYDGFSVFHVGSDGLIYKHVVDKMMPDEEREAVASPIATPQNLALFIGLSTELSPLIT